MYISWTCFHNAYEMSTNIKAKSHIGLLSSLFSEKYAKSAKFTDETKFMQGL